MWEDEERRRGRRETGGKQAEVKSNFGVEKIN